MSAIAERIDLALRSLPVEQAERFEAVLRQLLAFAQDTVPERAANRHPAPYRTQPQPLGLKAGLSYDNWAELLDVADGAGWK